LLNNLKNVGFWGLRVYLWLGVTDIKDEVLTSGIKEANYENAGGEKKTDEV